MDGTSPYEIAHAESLRRCPEIDRTLARIEVEIAPWLRQGSTGPLPAAKAAVHEAIQTRLTMAIKSATTRLRSALVQAILEQPTLGDWSMAVTTPAGEILIEWNESGDIFATQPGCRAVKLPVEP